MPVSAEETWAALTGDDVSSWTAGMKELRWTSERPFGVGTTREVRMRGNFVLRERFYRWEEGYRKTFTGVESSHPIFRFLAEDYVVEPTRHGGSCLTWRFAAQVRPEWGPFGRLLDWMLFRPVGRSHIEGMRERLSVGH
ncbi:SRPBCC family protein [Nocardia terpenica]